MTLLGQKGLHRPRRQHEDRRQPMLKVSEPHFPFADVEMALFVGACIPTWALRFGHWWSGRSRKGARRGGGNRGASLTEPRGLPSAHRAAGRVCPRVFPGRMRRLFVFGHMHFPRDCREGAAARGEPRLLGRKSLLRRAGRGGGADAENAGQGLGLAIKRLNDDSVKQYLDLLRRIKTEGVVRGYRTGTGTKGVFGTRCVSTCRRAFRC